MLLLLLLLSLLLLLLTPPPPPPRCQVAKFDLQPEVTTEAAQAAGAAAVAFFLSAQARA